MADVEPAPPSFWRAVGLAFETTVRNARTCLVLVAAYAVLNGVSSAIGQTLSVEVDPTRASPGELIAVGAAALAGIGTLVIVGIFVFPPTMGALSLVGSSAVTGDVLETHGIVRRVLDRALEVIGAFVLTVLILLAAPILIGVVGVLVGVSAGAEAAFAALLFVTLLLIVPGIYVFVRLSLAVPVVLREGLGPVKALRRSWDLVGGSWWWVFGVMIVVGIGASIVSGVASTVLSLGNTGLYSVRRDGETNFVLSALGSTAGAAVSGALFGVVSGVIYASRARVKPPAELPMPDRAIEAPSDEAPPAAEGISPESHGGSGLGPE